MFSKIGFRFVLAVFAALFFVNSNALIPAKAEAAEGEELTNVITSVENGDFKKASNDEYKQDIKVKGEFLLPAEAKAGDYFALQYPEELDILFEKSDYITDADGEKLIDFTIDEEKKEIQFEVLESVNELGPLAGDFSLDMTVDRNVLQTSTPSNGTVNLEYKHGENTFEETTRINYDGMYEGSHIAKFPIKVEGDEITWAVLLNLQGKLDNNDYYVEEHFTSSNFHEITGEFIEQDITIYEVTIHNSLGYDIVSSGQAISLNELDEETQYTSEFSLEKDTQYMYEVTTKMLPDQTYFYSASFLANNNYDPSYVDDGGASAFVNLISNMRGSAEELPTADVELLKVNEEEEPLSDAIFELKGTDEAENLKTDDEGLIQIEELLDGEYTLTETAAPNGYDALEEAITIEVSDGDWSLIDNQEEELVSKDESQLKIINIAVDKTDLESLINEADDLEADDHTETSFKPVTTALEKAKDVLEKDDATQKEVNTALDNLQEAIDNLVNIADLSKLVADADELEAKDYTEESFATVTSPLENATQVLANDDATQDEVDTAAGNLQNALDSLVEVGDKGDLSSLVEDARALNESDYTTNSFKDVKSALDAADKVLTNENATQSDVDEAFENLETAIDSLTKVGDKSKLSSLVKEAENLDEADYTTDSFKDVTSALEAAQNVLANDEATQDEVDAAAESLEQAINKLENATEPEPEVNKDALEALVTQADGFDADDYTENSFADLTAALVKARAVLANDEATQDEVDAAAESLEQAINKLENATEPEPELNTDALEDLITQADALQAVDYTADSFAELTAALEEAKTVLRNEGTTQEAVNSAASKLQEAIDKLVEATEPDPEPELNTDALEKLVTQADDFQAVDYTDDSFTTLTIALESAKQVLANADATQDEVDSAVGNLQKAMDNLVEATKPDPEQEVDTNTLKSLIAQADNLNSSNYTDDSFANITIALQAAKDVLADEDATQENVNAAANKLQEAIHNLVEATKPDPEPEVDTNALESLIAQADNLNPSNYTDDSFANITTALQAAKEVLADEDATQENVNAAANKLQEAIHNLVEATKPDPKPEVDINALESLIAKANGYNAADYTEKSFAALTVALEAAKDVLADDHVTQDNVDTAVANLQHAIDKLVAAKEEEDSTPEPKPENVDKDDLNNLVDDAKGFDAKNYTEESYKDFTTALKDANKVLANKDATQEEIDAALDTLQKAIDHLVKVETTMEVPSDEESDEKAKEDNHEVVVETEDDGGSLLPSTATSTFNMMLVGLFALIAGVAGVFMYRRKLN